MTDRIDRIEEGLAQLQQIVAGLASSQSRATDTVEALTALVQSHHGTIDALQGLSQQLVDTQIRTFESIDQMQSEIRGLQTENRRILDQLQGLHRNDD
jgi:ABC-type transporter Mla subunit MlaD